MSNYGLTVRQLIALLAQCDPEAVVVTEYEGDEVFFNSVERHKDGPVELIVGMIVDIRPMIWRDMDGIRDVLLPDTSGK